MRILLIEPGKPPISTTVDDSLEAMQAIVDGYIQAVYPFEEPVALVCNEEGKLLGLPLNRALRHPETGVIYDIIAGTFFLCSAPPDSDHFESMSEEQITQYTDCFKHPEIFPVTSMMGEAK